MDEPQATHVAAELMTQIMTHLRQSTKCLGSSSLSRETRYGSTSTWPLVSMAYVSCSSLEPVSRSGVTLALAAVSESWMDIFAGTEGASGELTSKNIRPHRTYIRIHWVGWVEQPTFWVRDRVCGGSDQFSWLTKGSTGHSPISINLLP